MNIMEAEEPGEVIQVTPKKGDTNPDWKKSVWVSSGERAWVIVSQGRLDGRANVITAPVLLWVVQKVAAQSEPFRNALIRMLLDSQAGRSAPVQTLSLKAGDLDPATLEALASTKDDRSPIQAEVERSLGEELAFERERCARLARTADSYRKTLVDIVEAFERVSERFDLVQPGIALFRKHAEVLSDLSEEIKARREEVQKLQATHSDEGRSS